MNDEIHEFCPLTKEPCMYDRCYWWDVDHCYWWDVDHCASRAVNKLREATDG